MDRREFIESLAAFTVASGGWPGVSKTEGAVKKTVSVGAHVWVYASRFPPDYDSTPIIDNVFSDLKFAGVDGVELMHTNFRQKDALSKISSTVSKFNLPVIGSSYTGAMWNKDEHAKVFEECHSLFEKLQKLKAKNFGISVGDAGHVKTEDELDAQAEILARIQAHGKKYGVICNLHNHTYEVENNFHDLGGTLKRLPHFPLGPDLNWLIRAGANPVEFIERHKQQIIYLHIRDQHNTGDWSEAVGEGDTDFNAISDALRKVNFTGTATVELAFPPGFAPTRELKDSWKKSCGFVRNTFGWPAQHK